MEKVIFQLQKPRIRFNTNKIIEITHVNAKYLIMSQILNPKVIRYSMIR